MLVFASISLKMCLASGALPQTLEGLNSAHQTQRSTTDTNVGGVGGGGGVRLLHQHSHWVIGGKIVKRLKTPAVMYSCGQVCRCLLRVSVVSASVHVKVANLEEVINVVPFPWCGLITY